MEEETIQEQDKKIEEEYKKFMGRVKVSLEKSIPELLSQAFDITSTDDLYAEKNEKRIKVFITVRDRTVPVTKREEDTLQWSYFGTINRGDILAASDEKKGKIKEFLDDKELYNNPRLFSGRSVSGKISPEKNWYFTNIQKSKRLSNNQFYKVDEFDEAMIYHFIDHCLPDKRTYCPQGNAIVCRKCEIRDAFANCLETDQALETEIEHYKKNKLPADSPEHERPKKELDFRILTTAVDWHYLYKDYAYAMGIGGIIGAYHIWSIYICFPELNNNVSNCFQRLSTMSQDQYLSPGELADKGSNGWRTFIQMVDQLVQSKLNSLEISLFRNVFDAYRYSGDNQEIAKKLLSFLLSIPEEDITYQKVQEQNQIEVVLDAEQANLLAADKLYLPKPQRDNIGKIHVMLTQNLVEKLIRDLTYFLQKEIEPFHAAATRNAAIATMTHAFAHDIGSHALIHLAEDTMGRDQELSHFLTYLYEKSGFWAGLSYLSDPLATIGDFVEVNHAIELFKDQQKLCKKLLESELGQEPNDFQIVSSIDDGSDQDGIKEIWFPWNSTMGEQALYTIFETVIRNLKHYIRASDCDGEDDRRKAIIEERISGLNQKLELHLSFGVDPNYLAFWKVKVWDGTKVRRDKTRELNTERCSVWDFMNHRLEHLSIMDQDGQPNFGGVSEMAIAATILRGFNVTLYDKKELSMPPLLSLEGKSTNNLNEDKLEYVFYLWKGQWINNALSPSFESDIRKGIETPYRSKFFLFLSANESLLSGIRKFRKGLIGESREGKQPSWRVSDEVAHSAGKLYLSWVARWLQVDEKSIRFEGDPSKFVTFKWGDESQKWTHGKGDANITYTLSSDIGKRLNDEFRKIDKDGSAPLDEYPDTFLKLICEIVESLGTKVFVADERAFRRFSTDDLNVLKGIGLSIYYPETGEAIPKELEHFRFTIFHSSLLQDLYPTEEKLLQFAKNLTKKTILVVTSGKEPPYWLQSLENCFFIQWNQLDSSLATPVRIDTDTYGAYEIKRRLVETMMNRGVQEERR